MGQGRRSLQPVPEQEPQKGPYGPSGKQGSPRAPQSVTAPQPTSLSPAHTLLPSHVARGSMQVGVPETSPQVSPKAAQSAVHWVEPSPVQTPPDGPGVQVAPCAAQSMTKCGRESIEHC